MLWLARGLHGARGESPPEHRLERHGEASSSSVAPRDARPPSAAVDDAEAARAQHPAPGPGSVSGPMPPVLALALGESSVEEYWRSQVRAEREAALGGSQVRPDGATTRAAAQSASGGCATHDHPPARRHDLELLGTRRHEPSVEALRAERERAAAQPVDDAYASRLARTAGPNPHYQPAAVQHRRAPLRNPAPPREDLPLGAQQQEQQRRPDSSPWLVPAQRAEPSPMQRFASTQRFAPSQRRPHRRAPQQPSPPPRALAEAASDAADAADVVASAARRQEEWRASWLRQLEAQARWSNPEYVYEQAKAERPSSAGARARIPQESRTGSSSGSRPDSPYRSPTHSPRRPGSPTRSPSRSPARSPRRPGSPTRSTST